MEDPKLECFESSIIYFLEYFGIEVTEDNSTRINNLLSNSNISRNPFPGREFSNSYEESLIDYSNTFSALFDLIKKDIEESDYSENLDNFFEEFDKLKEKIAESIQTHHERADEFNFEYITNMMYVFMNKEFPKLSIPNNSEMPVACSRLATTSVEAVLN